MPFSESVRRENHPTMNTVQNARAYAISMLSDFANAANPSLTVKLFDGDAAAEASKGMASPYFVN